MAVFDGVRRGVSRASSHPTVHSVSPSFIQGRAQCSVVQLYTSAQPQRSAREPEDSVEGAAQVLDASPASFEERVDLLR